MYEIVRRNFYVSQMNVEPISTAFARVYTFIAAPSFEDDRCCAAPSVHITASESVVDETVEFRSMRAVSPPSTVQGSRAG